MPASWRCTADEMYATHRAATQRLPDVVGNAECSQETLSPDAAAPLTSMHCLAKTAPCSASLDGLFWKMAEEDIQRRCETAAELQNPTLRAMYGLTGGRPGVRAGHPNSLKLIFSFVNREPSRGCHNKMLQILWIKATGFFL